MTSTGSTVGTGRRKGPLSPHSMAELQRRRSSRWRARPPDVLPMWLAEMDTPLAEPVTAALSAAAGRGDTGSAVAGGLPEAFAAFAGRRYGWSPEPDGIRLVPDVTAGVVEALRLVTEPGARVVVNTPAYPPFLHLVQRAGRRIVESPLALGPAGHGLDLDRLERDFAAGAGAYLLSSPHDPTGVVFGHSELLAVAELADRYEVRVVVDEIHAPLTYPDARHVPFGSLDAPATARSITLVSASKAWNLAGLEAALVVPGPEARAEVAGIDEEVSQGTGLLGVIASEAAFNFGEPWLAELMAGLDGNRRLLGGLLAERLPEIGYQRPGAAYLAWLDCRRLMLGDDPAAVFRRRAGVALFRGPDFGATGNGFAGLNFATAPERVAEAVERMASCRGAGAISQRA